MGKAVWLYNNKAASGTLTCANADGLTLPLLIDDIPQTYCNSTGTSLTPTWDMGATPPAISGVAVCSHNLPLTGAVNKIQFSTVSNFASIAAEFNLINVADMAQITFATQTYRYVRLLLNVLAGTVQVGEILLAGSVAATTRNHNWGYKEIGRQLEIRNVINGQMSRSVQSSLFAGYEVTYESLSSTDAAIIKGLAGQYPVVFVPDVALGQAYHGYFDNDSIETRVNAGNYSDISLKFWQNPPRPAE